MEHKTVSGGWIDNKFSENQNFVSLTDPQA